MVLPCRAAFHETRRTHSSWLVGVAETATGRTFKNDDASPRIFSAAGVRAARVVGGRERPFSALPKLQGASQPKKDRAAHYRVVNNYKCPGSQTFDDHGEPHF